MTDVKTKSVKVEQGEDLATFAERNGTDAKTVVQLNEIQMREHAAARGFDHSFRRETADESGKVTTTVDYHVFAGEELLVPDTDKKDTATNDQHFEG